jgi:hypothetical protein
MTVITTVLITFETQIYTIKHICLLNMLSVIM